MHFIRYGFSLVEMLITLSIFGILLSISLPMLKDWLAETESKLLQASMVHILETAREEADIRHVPIALCYGSAVACDAHTTKQTHLILFTNTHEDGVVKEAALTTLALPTKGKLHWRFFPANRNYLLFFPASFLRHDNGSFWYCQQKKTKPEWGIVLNQAGRVRVALPDATGKILDSEGKALRC